MQHFQILSHAMRLTSTHIKGKRKQYRLESIVVNNLKYPSMILTTVSNMHLILREATDSIFGENMFKSSHQEKINHKQTLKKMILRDQINSKTTILNFLNFGMVNKL